MIPTQNKPALIGYYCGVFGLIPFIGFPLAVTAIILGIIGLSLYKRQPTPGAQGHAITAIVLGGLHIMIGLGLIIFLTIRAASY